MKPNREYKYLNKWSRDKQAKQYLSVSFYFY